jgi:hypothetical protein
VGAQIALKRRSDARDAVHELQFRFNESEEVQMTSKIIVALTLAISGNLLFTPYSHADDDAGGGGGEPFVCMVDQQASSGDSSAADLIQLAAFQCKNLKIADTSLQAIALTMTAGSIYLACTGVGAPVSVTLQGAAVGIQVIDLIVGNLPCDDQKQEEKIKTAAKQVVCSELIRQGLTCTL